MLQAALQAAEKKDGDLDSDLDSDLAAVKIGEALAALLAIPAGECPSTV